MTTGLRIENLSVTYPGPPPVVAVDRLSLDIASGECLGILGESGSGKSTLVNTVLGLLPQARVEGHIRLGDLDLTHLDEAGWRDVRWKRISLAAQSAASLNPVLRVGVQLAEPQEVHLGRSRAEADAHSAALLTQVGLGDWALHRYARELSGGQRRLVLLAQALVCDPEVILLDEPTAGLDPAIRNTVIRVLRRLHKERGQSIVMLSHDAEAVGDLADRVAILYRGWLAETGPADRVLDDPRAPYSWALLNARPTLASVKELRGIRGDPPNPTDHATGCPFFGRCMQGRQPECTEGRPPLLVPNGESDGRVVACVRGGLVPVLEARGLRKTYPIPGRLLQRQHFVAVDGVSLDVREGEVLGLVGSTGAGKSTVASLLLRLLEPDAGTVVLEGHDLLAAKGEELKRHRRRIQVVFQDPFEALSPRLRVLDAVREPLDMQGIGTREERDARARASLVAARLPADDAFFARYTHELSGGQLQRVALARALILEPKLLIADEPVSMLDPSEQAKMLQLFKQLQVERGMAMIFVSHDLATVLRIADRVVVLSEGRVVEQATGTDLLIAPRHPATQALLGAAGRDALLAALVENLSTAAARAAVTPPNTRPQSEVRTTTLKGRAT